MPLHAGALLDSVAVPKRCSQWHWVRNCTRWRRAGSAGSCHSHPSACSVRLTCSPISPACPAPAAVLQQLSKQPRGEQAAGEHGSLAKRPKLGGQPSCSSGAATDTEVADGNGAAGAGRGGSCSPTALLTAQAAAGGTAGAALQSPTAPMLPVRGPGSPQPRLGPPAPSRVPRVAQPQPLPAVAGSPASQPASPAVAAASPRHPGSALPAAGGAAVPPALLHMLALQLPQAPASALIAIAQSIAAEQQPCPPDPPKSQPASPQAAAAAAAAAAMAAAEAALRQHALQQVGCCAAQANVAIPCGSIVWLGCCLALPAICNEPAASLKAASRCWHDS